MNKSVLAIVVVAILVLAGGGTYLALHKSNNKTTTPSTSSNQDNMPASSTQNSSNPTATGSVTIEGFAFSPADITVKKGSTVTWTNKDSATHTVTENDGQTGPDSGNLANGKSYSFTFATTGTFKYHCAIHPSMTGTVTVTE
ncbi:MAG: cupredoxin family copper-binding protein [Candidatus Saccharimonadales bacterium]